jgi:hypothetical protein
LPKFSTTSSGGGGEPESEEEVTEEEGRTFGDLLNEIPSSGDPSADFLATLFEKSNGNIQGVLELVDKYPLQKIQYIIKYWTELTKPHELREQEVQKKASRALEEFNFDTIKEDDKVILDSDGNPIDLSEFDFKLPPPAKPIPKENQ